jgi:1-acyl-sn-glycerol-3-phosphate acyltransferase
MDARASDFKLSHYRIAHAGKAAHRNVYRESRVSIPKWTGLASFYLVSHISIHCQQALRQLSPQMRESLAILARRVRRLSAFLAAAFYGLWEHRKLRRDASRAECAEWLHESCIRGIAALNLQILATGQFPSGGMIVSNHLSYLDILVFSAALPCVFVSKAEVQRWPIFGRYARWAGSVFVRRHDRADAARANVSVTDSLRNGVPVVLFPEGTTTNGDRILRFHSTMLQPAIEAEALITPCAIRYELDDGNASKEVCWWGDMPLLSHFRNLLGKKVIRGQIAFGEPMLASGDRKELSHILHKQVVNLHDRLQRSAMSQRNDSLDRHRTR